MSAIPRIFHHFTEWEDWRAGMYRRPTGEELRTMPAACAALLSDQNRFLREAQSMVESWPRAAEENLTNTEHNRRAWVGQATCTWSLGAPELATRVGWSTMTEGDQAAANLTADRVIDRWILHADFSGGQMLLPTGAEVA